MNRIQYAVQFTGNLDIKTVRTTKLTFKIPSKLISMFLTDNNYCIQCTTICQTDSNHCIQCTAIILALFDSPGTPKIQNNCFLVEKQNNDNYFLVPLQASMGH